MAMCMKIIFRHHLHPSGVYGGHWEVVNTSGSFVVNFQKTFNLRVAIQKINVRRPPRSVENKKKAMCMKIIFCHQSHLGGTGWHPEAA